MKSLEGLSRRLAEVEKAGRSGSGPDLDYSSRSVALAQILTGIAIQTPELWEMTWVQGGHLPRASDGQKLKWIIQLPTARLEEIRASWMASTFERDKAALKELERLEPMLMQGSDGYVGNGVGSGHDHGDSAADDADEKDTPAR